MDMKSDSSVIKLFSKFLEPKSAKKVKNIDEVKSLPISNYKFLNSNNIEILEKLFSEINIEKAAKLDKDNPIQSIVDIETSEDSDESNTKKEELNKNLKEISNEYPELEDLLKKTITISSIIMAIKSGKLEESKTGQKVIVVGLDNAGKTAILTKFGDRLGIENLAKIKPTKGIDRRHVKSKTLDLFIWDFGGQESIRKKYFQYPEKYFLQLDLLIYVIDVQDQERFDESFVYFNDILNVLITLEENPYILIFIHKYDPDIRNEPNILLNVEYLKDNLKEFFENKKYDFDFEIYLTSIFSLISNEPRFSKYIKNIMKANAITDPTYKKVDGLAKILEETMNAIIKLSESISKQLNDIDSRLSAIESGAFQIAQGGVPIEIQSQNEPVQNRVSARGEVLKELKDLFAKKRSLNV
jgi:hypothetical protein